MQQPSEAIHCESHEISDYVIGTEVQDRTCVEQPSSSHRQSAKQPWILHDPLIQLEAVARGQKMRLEHLA